MCWNALDQCGYCGTSSQNHFEPCNKLLKTGKLCLADNFQTRGHAFHKEENGNMAFNADTMSHQKFKTKTCQTCHNIELQVLETIPGPQSLYEYNSDEKDTNGQHINPAVVDGTTQVVRLGWDAWREKLSKYSQLYQNMNQPKSHSGLTDDEDEPTPPPTPPSPEDGQKAMLRKRLVQIQTDIRQELNQSYTNSDPKAKPLGIAAAMVEWGDQYPILRIRADIAPISKIKAAIKHIDDEAALYGNISSSTQMDVDGLLARHGEWADWVRKGGQPPRPHSAFIQVDERYRRQYGLMGRVTMN